MGRCSVSLSTTTRQRNYSVEQDCGSKPRATSLSFIPSYTAFDDEGACSWSFHLSCD